MKIREKELKDECMPELPTELLKLLDEGIEDVKAGRVIPYKEAMKKIRDSLSQ